MSEASPTATQQVNNVEKPKSTEPHGADRGDRGKVDAKGFIAGALIIVIIAGLLVCLISGRWMKTPGTDSWSETGLWSTCQCREPWKTTEIGSTCNKYKQLILATEAFSVIAVILEIFLTIILFKDATNESKGLGVVAALLGWAIVIFLVLTWAIFGAAYEKTYCGFKVRDSALLHWAYGIRCAECGVYVLFSIALSLQAIGKIKRNRAYFLIALIVLSIGVITTTSRGWLKSREQLLPAAAPAVNATADQLFRSKMYVEGGLWQTCQCVQVPDLPCSRRRNLLRAAEAFGVGSILLAAFLLVLLSDWMPATPKHVSVIVAVLSWFGMLLVWICYASFFSRKYCGTKIKNSSERPKLHWAFGLQVALSVLYIAVLIITIVKARLN